MLVSPKTVGGGMARLTQVDELADSGGGFRCVRIVASGNVVESCIPDWVFLGGEGAQWCDPVILQRIPVSPVTTLQCS